MTRLAQRVHARGKRAWPDQTSQLYVCHMVLNSDVASSAGRVPVLSKCKRVCRGRLWMTAERERIRTAPLSHNGAQLTPIDTIAVTQTTRILRGLRPRSITRPMQKNHASLEFSISWQWREDKQRPASSRRVWHVLQLKC